MTRTRHLFAVLLFALYARGVYAQEPEPRVNTSPDMPATSAAPAPAPAPAPAVKAAPVPAAKPAPAPAAKPAPATAKPAPDGRRAMDRLELDATQITGNRELPKVLYIVPWKRPDLGDLMGRPANSLLDEVLEPVDRDVFKRQNRYYQALQPDARRETAAPSQ